MLPYPEYMPSCTELPPGFQNASSKYIQAIAINLIPQLKPTHKSNSGKSKTSPEQVNNYY